MAEFVKVATVTDVPRGQGRTIEIGPLRIALFNLGGEFLAVEALCPHRGGPLADGLVDRRRARVICPWHGWPFDLRTGRTTRGEDDCVRTYPVQVEGDEVRIDIDGDPTGADPTGGEGP